MSFKESVATFGPGGILVGVWCEPAWRRAGAPAVLTTNVGLNHRVGPHRLNVELARLLALDGVPSLRFDLNGLGDSQQRPGALNELERAAVDMQDAAALAVKKGCAAVVPVGLCSSTDPSHRLLVDDARVAGAAFIDGYAYPTPRATIERSLLRYRDRRFIKRALYRRMGRKGGPELGEQPDLYTREYPEPAALGADFERALQRGSRLLFVFTGGVDNTYNYERQFYDMLKPAKLEGRVELEYWPEADHTFTLLAQRRRLLARLRQFLSAIS